MSPRPVGAEEVIRVEHIAKRFGPVVALRDINLNLTTARRSGCSATTAAASRP
jgi:ABC-type sugar transport system ATPase subunit